MCTRLRSKKYATLAFFPVLFQQKQNPNDHIPDNNEMAVKQARTGFHRVIDLFKLDEFGSPSKELLSTLHTAMFSGLLGGSLAGLKETQLKYQDFVTKMNSEMFVSHTEAKNALTRKMAISFVKGFSHWGSRMAFFSSLFTLNVNILGAYNDRTSILHFVTSGCVTGSIYRIPMGLRAMIAAGTVGGCLGLIAGCLSIGLLTLFGTSYDEIEDWHYRVRNLREAQFQEAMDQNEQQKQSNPILEDRTEIMKNAALEALKDNCSENQTLAPVRK